MAVISSPRNPLVKRLVRLHRPAGRREQGRFLIEGRRAIAGFLAAGWQPLALYLREDIQETEGHWREAQGLTAPVFAKVSQWRTPSGHLAEFALPAPPAIEPANGGLCCHGIRDPGNLGSLLRSAAAFAWSQVLLVDCCDPYAAKCLQASTGGLAHVRLLEGNDALLGACLAAAPGVALVCTGGRAQLPAKEPCWLLVGGEAEGLPAAIVARCRHRLSLPMASGVESLNAGVAGAIALYLLR